MKRYYEEAQSAYQEGQAVLATLNAQYDEMISWADLYDTASIESKKMIIHCLIRRIDVYRDYQIHVEFNMDSEQFQLGLDMETFAA